MFERFTDRARRVVVLAQEEARRLNHNYIGTEHILLGLLQEGEGVAAEALESLGISLEAGRVQVEEIIGRGLSAPTGHIPFIPPTKKAPELSLQETMQLGHNYMGTEHILLGVSREGEGVGAQVLAGFGADYARVREQVVRLLTGEGEQAGPRAAALRDRERQSLADRARREREWMADVDVEAVTEENQRLHREVERLRDLLRQRGIEPDGGNSQTA